LPAQRQFDEAMGISLKTLARTIRFEAIRNRLMLEPNANLAGLAYEFGYADQAHFIKDFKAFTKQNPKRVCHRDAETSRNVSRIMSMSYVHNRRNPRLIILGITYKRWRHTIMKKNLTFGLIVKDYDEVIDFYSKMQGFAVERKLE
jgi:AraC-like DNA-binding protein